MFTHNLLTLDDLPKTLAMGDMPSMSNGTLTTVHLQWYACNDTFRFDRKNNHRMTCEISHKKT